MYFVFFFFRIGFEFVFLLKDVWLVKDSEEGVFNYWEGSYKVINVVRYLRGYIAFFGRYLRLYVRYYVFVRFCRDLIFISI